MLVGADSCQTITGRATCPGQAVVHDPSNPLADYAFGDYFTGQKKGQPTPEKKMICDKFFACKRTGKDTEATISRDNPNANWGVDSVRCT